MIEKNRGGASLGSESDYEINQSKYFMLVSPQAGQHPFFCLGKSLLLHHHVGPDGGSTTEILRDKAQHPAGFKPTTSGIFAPCRRSTAVLDAPAATKIINKKTNERTIKINDII